jgi:hypothetical protein
LGGLIIYLGKKSLLTILALLFALFLCGTVSAVNSTDLKVNKLTVSSSTGEDLVVSSIIAPTNAFRGQKVLVPNTIKNQGNQAAGGNLVNYYIRASVSGPSIYIGHRYIGGIGAGNSNHQHTTLFIPTSISPGKYYIIAYVDSTKIIRETNELNNIRYTSTKINILHRGYWINNGPGELKNINTSSLKKAGVTDLFAIIDKDDPKTTLTPYVNAISGSGIRLHAWILCFKDRSGNWYNPDSNPVAVSELVNKITSISLNYNVDGIHLDYVRYPGNAYKHPYATQTVTSFVKRVYNKLHSINSLKIPDKHQIKLSAALMPECSKNSYYYGQDYGQLSHYLDYLIPMVYKGNFNGDSAWITRTSQYIVNHSNGKPVLIGLQTYTSDTTPVPLPNNELYTDIKASIVPGSYGYVLFKYEMLNSNTPGIPPFKKVTLSEVSYSSSALKNYIDKYHRLPSNITVGRYTVPMSTMIYLLTNSVYNINNGNYGLITVRYFREPADPFETFSGGTISRTDYINMAHSYKNIMDIRGKALPYIEIKQGKVRYESLIYMYSRIMDAYGLSGRLPVGIPLGPW